MVPIIINNLIVELRKRGVPAQIQINSSMFDRVASQTLVRKIQLLIVNKIQTKDADIRQFSQNYDIDVVEKPDILKKTFGRNEK